MSAPKGRILIVEDDVALAQLLEGQLAQLGYHAESVGRGGDGIYRAEEGDFDLLLLDLNLPDMDGLEVAEWLRGRLDTPILMLTARGDVDSRVAGLYAGASDYLTKPFSVQELAARVHVQLRDRSGRADDRLRHGDLELDPETRVLERGAERCELPELECALLALLLRHRGRVFAKEELLRRLYPGDPPGSNTLEVFVHNLRRRLGELGADPLIRTVRGKGYLIR